MSAQKYDDDHGAFTADLQRALDVVFFGLRAVGRRRQLAIAIFLLTVVAAAGALAVMPKMYRVQTRLLTHKAYVLPALVSPRRSVPLQADAPTRGAVELIKSREVLSGIIEDANVKQTWSETRTLVGRTKDMLRELLKGPMSDEDFEEALLEMLDKRLIAYIDADVVVMEVTWHDAPTAMALSEATHKRFLMKKKEGELSEVHETLRILETNVEGARRNVEAASEDFASVLQAKTKGGVAPIRMRSIRVRKPSAGPGPEVAARAQKKVELERELASLQQSLAGRERQYQGRLDEANRTLSGLRQTLGPQHPDVQNAIRVVEERSRVPADLMSLRAQAADLDSRLRRLDESRSGGSPAEYTTIQVPDESAVAESRTGAEGLDPDIERAERALNTRIARYNEFLVRLEDARTELATADAAFDYRFVLTLPPLFPKREISPNGPVILAGGVIAGLFLALLLALAADLWSRRVLEKWQLERLGVPVIGDITVSRVLLPDNSEQDAA
jgi:uncharacterized protein involved in exopolysaccharide biosynthesis